MAVDQRTINTAQAVATGLALSISTVLAVVVFAAGLVTFFFGGLLVGPPS